MIQKTILDAIQQVFDQIITISKHCQLPNVPHKLSLSTLIDFMVPLNLSTDLQTQHYTSSQKQHTKLYDSIQILEGYKGACDHIKKMSIEYQELSLQYLKLEELLQKNQTEIRKHIGTEQQLRLFIETLKAQYQESEGDRLDLLQNSKTMIKNLKSQNQKLYMQIQSLSSQNKHHKSILKSSRKKSRESSNQKTSSKKTNQRNKTQYVETSHKNQQSLKMHSIKLPKGKNKPTNIKKDGFPKKKINTTQYSHKKLVNSSSNNKNLMDPKKKQPNYLFKHNYPPKHQVSKEMTPLKNPYIQKMTKNKYRSVLSASRSKSKNKSHKKAHKSVFSISSLDLQGQEQQRSHQMLKASKDMGVMQFEKFRGQSHGLQRYPK